MAQFRHQPGQGQSHSTGPEIALRYAIEWGSHLLVVESVGPALGASSRTTAGRLLEPGSSVAPRPLSLHQEPPPRVCDPPRPLALKRRLPGPAKAQCLDACVHTWAAKTAGAQPQCSIGLLLSEAHIKLYEYRKAAQQQAFVQSLPRWFENARCALARSN